MNTGIAGIRVVDSIAAMKVDNNAWTARYQGGISSSALLRLALAQIRYCVQRARIVFMKNSFQVRGPLMYLISNSNTG